MLENGEEVPRGFQWLCQFVNTIRAQLRTFPLSTFWNQALHMSGRESFSLQKVIQVRYHNESGVNEGGLKMDFFSILMAQLLTSNLLTQDTDNVGYSPSANVQALQQGRYTTWDTHPVRQYKDSVHSDQPTRTVYTAIGRMVAAMLLQGAGMPPVFSHLFLQYGLYGCKLQEIPVASQHLQTILDRVKNDYIRVVQFDDEVVTLMASAGMTCQLTQRNRAEVARPLALQASPVTM